MSKTIHKRRRVQKRPKFRCPHCGWMCKEIRNRHWLCHHCQTAWPVKP